MGHNIALLRASFDRVIERDPTMKQGFYDDFYAALFKLYPQTWPMFFRTTLADQQKMLTETMVAIMDYLDQASWVRDKLLAMGVKHVEYATKTEMYPWVADALLAALAKTMGDDWNDELAREWRGVYDAIVAVMLEGAATVPAAAVPGKMETVATNAPLGFLPPPAAVAAIETPAAATTPGPAVVPAHPPAAATTPAPEVTAPAEAGC